jgi:chemosensory pili system protein ChpC
MDSENTVLDLSALLLPVTGRLLVVPTSVVAEIIKRRELTPPDGAPDWLLGHVKWHHEAVPVLSFEALNGEPVAEEETGSRIVIIGTLGDQAEQRRYALLTRGVPNLLRLTPPDIQQLDDVVPGPAESMRVRVHGQAAAIPDLDYIEKRLFGLLETVKAPQKN